MRRTMHRGKSVAAGARYQPYYCEENVWWLCQTPGLGDEVQVVFIANGARGALLAHQRAGGAAGIVSWDYHVVALARENDTWFVWDLDTDLGLPVSARLYLDATFALALEEPTRLARFRVIPATRFLATFTTDRSHMRAADGGWQAPPPSWDPPAVPGVPMNLMDFVDLETPGEGTVLTYSDMRARFCGRDAQE